MTETQVGELLERASAELRPTTDLVAGGIARGRRRRRRGLALTAAGGLAAAAVLGGALAVLAGLPGDGAGPDRSVVADPSGATGPSSYAAQPSPSPSATPVDATYDGPFPVAPEGIPSTLDKLLEGTVTHPQSQRSHPADPDGWQSGAVDLDGATVTIAFQHSTGPRCDGDAGLGSCTAVDGGFLGTYAAKVYSKGVGDTGVRDSGVTFYTPDGYKVSATASNAGSAAPTTPVMDDPVLDLAALTALAENPAWR